MASFWHWLLGRLLGLEPVTFEDPEATDAAAVRADLSPDPDDLSDPSNGGTEA